MSLLLLVTLIMCVGGVSSSGGEITPLGLGSERALTDNFHLMLFIRNTHTSSKHLILEVLNSAVTIHVLVTWL